MENDCLKALPKRYGAYAIVTGASEGIGQCFAEELAKAGMNVVLVARRQDQLDALAKAIVDCGPGSSQNRVCSAVKNESR